MSLTPLDVQLRIKVDTASWTDLSRPCPPEISALATPNRSTSVDAVLLWTAYCTRPPKTLGFSLADCWAWLRYRPALIDGPQLRLCADWDDIDPHQKNILSDDLGMGFSVELLSSSLNIQEVADTLHVKKVLRPNTYTLAKTGKRGEGKSPDFLLTDTQGQVSVLECKGTQSSHNALKKALEGGVKQKRNISRDDKSPFRHTLVAGLFVPGFKHRKSALIEVRDPDPHDLAQLLAGTATSTLRLAILQIALAKQLSLIGLSSWANALTTTPTAQLDQVEFPRDGNIPAQLASENIQTSQTYSPALDQAGQGARSMIFEAQLPAKVYDLLRGSSNMRQALDDLVDYRGERIWQFNQDGQIARLESPLGFVFSLEYR